MPNPTIYLDDTKGERSNIRVCQEIGPPAQNRALSWAYRSFFAIVDQGLISGSNFVLGVILARKLGAAEYGAYALSFATFLLLSSMHHALVLEPMSVFGASSYRFDLPHYLGLLLWVQIVIGAVCLLILAAVSEVFQLRGAIQMRPALIGVSFAAPAVLLLWFARRALYLEYSSKASAVGAVVYTGILFGLLKVFYRSLSPFSAFVSMGGAALVASVLLLIRIRPLIASSHLLFELRQIGSEHWRYGRWALASMLFIWMPWNFYYGLVSHFFGLAASGELRALINLALPMTQTYAALALLMLPRTSELAQREGWHGVKRQAMNIAGAFTLVAMTYWAVVVAWRTELLEFLYAGNYANVGHLVPWLALASIFSGMIFGPLCAFRAMRSPATILWVYSISTGLSFMLGIPATRAFGIQGAVFGILLSGALSLTMAAFWLVRTKDKHVLPVRMDAANDPAL